MSRYAKKKYEINYILKNNIEEERWIFISNFYHPGEWFVSQVIG